MFKRGVCQVVAPCSHISTQLCVLASLDAVCLCAVSNTNTHCATQQAWQAAQVELVLRRVRGATGTPCEGKLLDVTFRCGFGCEAAWCVVLWQTPRHIVLCQQPLVLVYLAGRGACSFCRALP
jgi:hypothetical protein